MRHHVHTRTIWQARSLQKACGTSRARVGMWRWICSYQYRIQKDSPSSLFEKMLHYSFDEDILIYTRFCFDIGWCTGGKLVNGRHDQCGAYIRRRSHKWKPSCMNEEWRSKQDCVVSSLEIVLVWRMEVAPSRSGRWWYTVAEHWWTF